VIALAGKVYLLTDAMSSVAVPTRRALASCHHFTPQAEEALRTTRLRGCGW
jgi:hypothetical protein